MRVITINGTKVVVEHIDSWYETSKTDVNNRHNTCTQVRTVSGREMSYPGTVEQFEDAIRYAENL